MAKASCLLKLAINGGILPTLVTSFFSSSSESGIWKKDMSFAPEGTELSPKLIPANSGLLM